MPFLLRRAHECPPRRPAVQAGAPQGLHLRDRREETARTAQAQEADADIRRVDVRCLRRMVAGSFHRQTLRRDSAMSAAYIHQFEQATGAKEKVSEGRRTHKYDQRRHLESAWNPS